MPADIFSSRRDMLRLALQLASGGALLELAGCAAHDKPPPLAAIPPGTLGIDVHCHVFNARDLPIEGFVVHVVLEADPFADEQLGALVTFIALILDSAASTADAEIAALQKHETQPVGIASAVDFRTHARNAAIALQTETPAASTATVIRRMHTVLSRTPEGLLPKPEDNPTGAAAGVNGTSEPAKKRRSAFLQSLAALKPGETVPGFQRKSAGFKAAARVSPNAAQPIQPEQQGPTADAVATAVANHAASQSGIFYLASLLTKPRAELLRDLIALPAPPDNTTIALFTPALVDFSYWLDDRSSSTDGDITKPPPDVTKLSDQIDVMSAIAAASVTWPGNPGFAMHPFVSFCPWRQVAELHSPDPVSPTQFELVKQAVLTRGFIGVKIYPLMGFKPIGNTAADPALFPVRLTRLKNFATEMDAALEALYAWCVAEDVPIMAHCAYSQYPSEQAGVLGGPAGWLSVLDMPAFKTLRLNLAHCGGVWDLAADRRATVRQKAGSLWPETVVAALGKPQYPNFFADIADYNDVLDCTASLAPAGPAPPAGDASSITALTRLVNANQAARQRIMYGTDYMFLTQYKHNEVYVARMRNCLAPLLGMPPADLMGMNAARFLGLTDARSGTRTRLDRFRGDRFLARWGA